MAGNFRKNDLRVIKTRQALLNALASTLSLQSFNKTSVNDLCEKALISRATFYVYFNDKYALLKYWLESLRNDLIPDVHQYEAIEHAVNRFIKENANLINHLIEGADREVMDMLHDFMYALIDEAVTKNEDGQPTPNQMQLANFCAGGMVSLLMWQMKNNYPPDAPMINPYVYGMLGCVTAWDAGLSTSEGRFCDA